MAVCGGDKKKMTIGELINELIMANIRIWHEDTKLRNGIAITDRQQAICCAKGRLLNKIRSDFKYEINKALDTDSYDDRKVNYTSGGNK